MVTPLIVRHRRTQILFCVIFVCLITAGSPCPADTIYKWTDDRGVITYSDTPPPGTAGLEEMSLRNARRDPTVHATSSPIAYEEVPEGCLVTVLINKRIPAKMILDTGANVVVVSTVLARRLGWTRKTDAATVTMLTASGSVQAEPLIIETLRLGSAEKTNVIAAIAPTGVLFDRCDGLLGMSFLGDFKLNIDTESRTIALTRRTGQASQ